MAEEALVLFNKGNSTLPAAVAKAVERAGFKTKERAGVAPTWKPSKPGEYVCGEILAVRDGVGEFGGTVVVVNDLHGIVSVWLGADLKTKLAGAVKEGQVYCIVYQGKLSKKDNPKLKNDMHQYNVVEILPA